MKTLLTSIIPILLLSSCSLLGGKSQNTVTTSTERLVEGEPVERITVTQPYVSPQQQSHAEATKSLFSE